jgi:hypothetical protein
MHPEAAMAPSDELAALRDAISALRAEAEPLQQQLQAIDEAVSRLDAATAERDRLLEAHDRRVAESIVHRQPPPYMDPAVNLAEIDLRKASGECRAALMVRPKIEGQLAAINPRLAALGEMLDEQTWLSVPSAASHLFHVADAARR